MSILYLFIYKNTVQNHFLSKVENVFETTLAWFIPPRSYTTKNMSVYAMRIFVDDFNIPEIIKIIN